MPVITKGAFGRRLLIATVAALGLGLTPTARVAAPSADTTQQEPSVARNDGGATLKIEADEQGNYDDGLRRAFWRDPGNHPHDWGNLARLRADAPQEPDAPAGHRPREDLGVA